MTPRLVFLPDGRLFVDYGGCKGSETFPSLEAARPKLFKWIDREHGLIVHQQAALAKMSRQLEGGSGRGPDRSKHRRSHASAARRR